MAMVGNKKVIKCKMAESWLLTAKANEKKETVGRLREGGKSGVLLASACGTQTRY